MREKEVGESAERDPILGEVRRAREALLAAAGYDLEEMVRRLRVAQERSGRPAVSRPPRPVEGDTGEAT